MPKVRRSGSDALLQMRDEFIALVSAYNGVGEHQDALDAQAIVAALAEFEDNHMLADVGWPAVVCPDDGTGFPFLQGTEEDEPPAVAEPPADSPAWAT